MGRELNGGWEGRLESENGAVIHTLMRVGTKNWLLFEGGNKLYQGGNKKISYKYLFIVPRTKLRS